MSDTIILCLHCGWNGKDTSKHKPSKHKPHQVCPTMLVERRLAPDGHITGGWRDHPASMETMRWARNREFRMKRQSEP